MMIFGGAKIQKIYYNTKIMNKKITYSIYFLP